MLHIGPLSTRGQAFSAKVREPRSKWKQRNHLVFTVNVCKVSSLFMLLITYQQHSHFTFIIVYFNQGPQSLTQSTLASLCLIQMKVNEWFGDMTEFHFTCWHAFEFQVLSCVCLFREITAACPPVFTSSCVQRTSTDNIQVRVYIWVTCWTTITSISKGCEQMCAVDLMSLWMQNSSIHTFSGNIHL